MINAWMKVEGWGDRRIQCLTKPGVSYASWRRRRRREGSQRASHQYNVKTEDHI